MRKILFIVVLFLIIFHPLPVLANNPDFQVVIGDEEYVYGPGQNFGDNAFYPVKTPRGFKVFSADGTQGNTVSMSGTTIESLQLDSGIRLQRGGLGSYDDCNASINSVYIDPNNSNHWLGWYHIEKNRPGLTDCSNDIKSMGAIESLDAGINWTKLGPILTGNENNPSIGDGKVMKVGNYFYVFYGSASIWKLHVARSLVSDKGLPGTWWKYFDGTWSQPGLGGQESPIDTIGAASMNISYNTYLNRYLAPFVSGRWGWTLFYTPVNPTEINLVSNWIQFPQFIYPLVSFTFDQSVDYWADFFGNNPLYKEWYAYPSIVGLNGESDISGKEFYIYYVKLFSGERFTQRYILRRKIYLTKNPNDTYYAKIALNEHNRQTPFKKRVSTEITKPSEGYSKVKTTGYLLPYQENGFKPIYECYVPSWQDYLPSLSTPYPPSDPTNSSALDKWLHCESDGDKFIRTIGYIAEKPIGLFSQPLYRCFDSQNLNHFLSTDVACEGKTKEFLMGYVQTANPEAFNLQGDLDANGKVDIFDYNSMLQNFGKTNCGNVADIDGNCKVNIFDYNTLIQNFGKTQ